MKTFIDLANNPVEIPGKAVEVAERLSSKKKKVKAVEAAAPEKKHRSPRPIRAFRYRGEPFMFINHDDLTIVCTVNKTTKQPEPIIEVPNDKARQAVRALTKIIQAESILEDLKR